MSTKIKKQLIERLKNHGWYVIDVTISTGGIPNLICCSPRGRFVGFRVVNDIRKQKSIQMIKEAISIVEKGGLFIEFDGSAESEKTLTEALNMEVRPMEAKK